MLTNEFKLPGKTKVRDEQSALTKDTKFRLSNMTMNEAAEAAEEKNIGAALAEMYLGEYEDEVAQHTSEDEDEEQPTPTPLYYSENEIIDTFDLGE